MASIKFDWKGVHKLLKNLKPHKASGPDAVPSFILKTLSEHTLASNKDVNQYHLLVAVITTSSC